MLSKKVRDFLNELEKETGTLPPDLHITRKACALVAISNGKVLKVQEPGVKHCPLFTKLFNHDHLDKGSIADKFARHTCEWGMFTKDRKICDDRIIVPFGASEMMMYALKRKNIDAAVVVCEGAGTVITDNPSLVQGIGAYMNGIFYTSPIKKTIEGIKNSGGFLLSEELAILDQFAGAKKALEMGFKRIAVTVRGDEDEMFSSIRGLEKSLKKQNIKIMILAVCNSGISEKQAENVKKYSDLAWSCASGHIRTIAGSTAILQVGMKIPVFVMTKNGLDFISSYSSDECLSQILKHADKRHFVTASKREKESIKLNMGRFSVYLNETDSLPVSTADEPSPLI